MDKIKIYTYGDNPVPAQRGKDEKNEDDSKILMIKRLLNYVNRDINKIKIINID